MKIKQTLLSLAIIATSLAGLYACSSKDAESEPGGEGSSVSGIADLIPANAGAAALINVKNFLESGGASLTESGIKLPSYFDEMVDKADLDKTNELLKELGVNIAYAGFCIDKKYSFPTLIIPVADKEKFEKYLTSEDFKEDSGDDGLKLYVNRSSRSKFSGSACAIKGSYAYLVINANDSSSSRLVDYIQNLIKEAGSAPISQTEYGKYMAEANVVGAMLNTTALSAQVPNIKLDVPLGYVCYNFNVSEDEARLTCVAFDTDGHKIDMKKASPDIDFSTPISAEALAYLPSSEYGIGAMSMKNVNWDNIFTKINKAVPYGGMDFNLAMSMMKTYLQNIDGTVAFGIGYNGSLEDIVNDKAPTMEELPFTMVIETLPGKAAGILKDLEALTNMTNMSVKNTSEGISMYVPELRGNIYAKADNNILVISNQTIQKGSVNPVAEQFGMLRYVAAFVATLKESTQIMRDLGIKENVTFGGYVDANTSECGLVLKITGDAKGGIIERFVRLVLTLNEKTSTLYRRSYNSRSYDYDYDYDYSYDYY